MSLTIRTAHAADLPAIVEIWYRAEVDESGVALPCPQNPPAIFRHLLATADLRIAEEDGRPVGFVALTTRGKLSYLALMFVLAECQSRGIGQALLHAVMLSVGGTICTAASTDPRAQALYIRAGMQPHWPLYHLAMTTSAVGPLRTDGSIARPTINHSPALHAWDTAISGQSRTQDHAAFGTLLPAIPLWVERDGTTIGYGFVQTAGEIVLAAPDAYTVGPVGARTADDAVRCVGAVVEWARQRARTVRIALPGPHPALGPLLDAGLRIVYVEQFMASGQLPFNPRCYCPCGAGIL